MSTDYRLLEKVRAEEIFCGQLERFGVREHLVAGETTERKKCLTDGRNYLWAYIDEDGFVSSFSVYGANAPGKVLNAVGELTQSDIVSEHEPQYWGFDTQAEWDAFMEEISREHDENFYANIVRYCRGEAHDLTPGTIGMYQAEAAKKLAEQDPTLLLPEHKQRLLNASKERYDEDHPPVVITLDEKDMALVQMLSTHEDDLPKG
jgi:hypothetical protein